MGTVQKFGVVFAQGDLEKTVIVYTNPRAEDDAIFALAEEIENTEGMERSYILELKGPRRELIEKFCA